jgi:zinc/manganese transport system permease protein
MGMTHTLGIATILTHPFLANALIAGTAIALAAGIAGYFLVLRGQVFTGDALGHVAFTGAAAALAFGLDVRVGLFVATIGIGLVMGLLGERGKADDVVIGNVLAWVLGLGVFFLTLFVSGNSAGNGSAGVNVLFGSVFGLGPRQTMLATVVALAVAAAQYAIARPLMFASVDPTVAAARGVPVRLLGVVFLALAGAATAEATQAVGALLLLGLLAAPAGTAQRLTSRPYRALLLSAGIAVFDMWVGLALSYYVPSLPPSFAIIAVAAAVFAAVWVATALPRTPGAVPASPGERRRRERIEALVVLGVAIAIALVAAYRARLGVSFYDDSHYVAVSLRLARGARPLADEMSLQSLGFLVPAAFVWVWTHFAGMNGLVLAFRLFYIALAAVAGAIVYRSLRRSFRPGVAGLAALIPLVCTPFNLLAPSYDTLAMLGLLVAFALSYSAWRTGARTHALFAGAAMAFATISYPPMLFASLALFGSLAWASRDRRLLALTAFGALAAAVLMLVPLALLVTPAEAHRAFAYASANVKGFTSPIAKLAFAAEALFLAMVVPGLIPFWLLVVGACAPRLPRWARGAILFALPVAATVPGVIWTVTQNRRSVFGNTAASWLITFAIGMAVPLALWFRRGNGAEIRRLLRLATPVGVVGYVVVAYSTDASLVRAVPIVGFAPLGLAVIAAWATMAEEFAGELGIAAASVLALGAVVMLLYTTTVDDRRPLTLTSGLGSGSGPFSHMLMAATRRDELRGVQDAGRRYVKPGDRVTFVGERNGYLLTGGVPYTNAVWLYVGPSDIAALQYFSAHGGLPDVVFIDHMSLEKLSIPSYEAAAPHDPLIRTVLAKYRLAETVADFGVFVRR